MLIHANKNIYSNYDTKLILIDRVNISNFDWPDKPNAYDNM
jgi:hypothetical protein